MHRCRGNARGLWVGSRGLVQRETKVTVVEAQMDEARYLLAAGAGQGFGAKAGAAEGIDYAGLENQCWTPHRIGIKSAPAASPSHFCR